MSSSSCTRPGSSRTEIGRYLWLTGPCCGNGEIFTNYAMQRRQSYDGHISDVWDADNPPPEAITRLALGSRRLFRGCLFGGHLFRGSLLGGRLFRRGSICGSLVAARARFYAGLQLGQQVRDVFGLVEFFRPLFGSKRFSAFELGLHQLL